MNDKTENKYQDLINQSKLYMANIHDKEHDLNHVQDVVEITKKLLTKIPANPEVCLIAAYWHDVGRSQVVENHEIKSAEMLKNYMEQNNYDNNLISFCYEAIKNHKWNMTPNTQEGWLVKDADKLAWIGQNRWKNCLKNNQRLDAILELLPKLKNEILYFEESKKIYDELIVKLVQLLSINIYDKMS